MSDNLIQQYIQKHQTIPVQTTSQVSNQGNSSEIPVINDLPQDAVSFLEMYANLKINEDLSNSGVYIEEGKINNRSSVIKTVVKTTPSGKKIFYKEGVIGNKDFILQSSHIKSSDKTTFYYNGQFNSKKIDLTVEIPMEKNKYKKLYYEDVRNRLYVPDEIKITGKIDNKPYSIVLPDVKVPRDSDEKDIVTMLLDNHCFHAGTINGNIVAIEPGKERIKKWESKTEKRQDFFNENVRPLISQTLSTALGAFLGFVIAKCTNKGR